MCACVRRSQHSARRLGTATLLTLLVGLGGCGGKEKVSYNTKPYVGHGNVADCTTFKSQAQAQAVLRADPTDRNGLDVDSDGIACPQLAGPRDDDRVKRIVITDKDGAPIDPDYETAKRKARERAKK